MAWEARREMESPNIKFFAGEHFFFLFSRCYVGVAKHPSVLRVLFVLLLNQNFLPQVSIRKALPGLSLHDFKYFN